MEAAAPTAPASVAPAPSHDAVGGVLSALWRRKFLILLPTIIAFGASLGIVSVLTPRYTGEARVLLENRDTVYSRAERDSATAAAIDPEAVSSQVQIIMSKDLALRVIRDLELNKKAEFDPVIGGVGLLKTLLVVTGFAKDPKSIPAEERVLDTYYRRLLAFPVAKSRVIAIEFQSEEPKLAADIANRIAQEYLKREEGAKTETSKVTSEWLDKAIEPLMKKVVAAEAKVEAFRSSKGLFIGTNNMTITSQQLAELNTNLSNARSQQADLQARARLIREAVREGRVFETSEVNNNDLVRRLLEQRANLKAQIAFDERTLLPGHPRMKELGSQLADLETQVRAAAERAARALENDSRAAGARVASLQAELDRLKRSAALSNEDEVQLKALERDATALREQLNSYRIRFLDAAARTSDSVQPADARIISRAFPQSEPTFPKKIPIVLLATLGTLVVASALVASQHLMSRQLEFALAGYGDMPAYAAPEPARSGGLLSFVRRAPAEQPDAPDLPGMDPGEGLVLPSRLTRATGNATAALAQQLANELAQMGYLGRGKVLLVLAADPRGRASNTALRFGRAMAGESGAVLVGLAGAPDFYQRLLPPGAVGFGAFLDRVAGLGETIHADARSPLHLVPPGHPLIGRLLSGEASLDIRQAIEAMARGYGLVLIDGGPAGGPGESLADLADAVLLSVRPGFEDAQAVADRLEPVLDGPVYLVDEAGGGERQAANDSYPSAREA